MFRNFINYIDELDAVEKVAVITMTTVVVIFTVVFFALSIIYKILQYSDISIMYFIIFLILLVALFIIIYIKKLKLGLFLLAFSVCIYTIYSTYLLGYNKNAIMLYPIILLVVHTNFPKWGKLRLHSTITIFIAFIVTLHLRFYHVAKYNDTLGYIEIMNLGFALGGVTAIVYTRKIAEGMVYSYTEQLNKITKEANVDFMTGLYNRRFMESVFLLEDFEESYIVIADIDYFKKINDTYGHNCGDDVLKEVALTLKQSFRSLDYVCRWGGEEFLIYIRNHEHFDIQHKLDTVRKQIECKPFEYEGTKFNVTMSFGYCLREKSCNIEKNIEYADSALYNAKQTGRNKVVGYSTNCENI